MNFSKYLRRSTTVLVFLIIFLTTFSKIYGQNSGNCKTPQAPQILEAEKILTNLGYWIMKIDCVKDSSTNHAVIAFQKIEKLKRTGILTNDLLNIMRNAARPVSK